MARIPEARKNHSIFIADVLGPYDVYKGHRNIDPGLSGVTLVPFPMGDPLYALSSPPRSNLVGRS
jgi:hypothetical protein